MGDYGSCTVLTVALKPLTVADVSCGHNAAKKFWHIFEVKVPKKTDENFATVFERAF